MHVLLAEDDVETAAYIEKGLREIGHTVDVAVTTIASLTPGRMATNPPAPVSLLIREATC